MSWNRNDHPLLALGAALALAATAGSAAAATLVVRSSGPAARSYPAGRALPPGGKIVLGPTDQVTILDAKGTRTFHGPGSFDPAAAGATTGTASTLATLVSQPGQRRARIGAVRSVGGAAAPRSPNLWYVTGGKSGAQCLADTSAVTLWRPDMTAEQATTITGGGKTATVSWLKGQSAHDWPAELPIANGAEYSLSAAGQPPVTLRFVLLGNVDGQPLDALAEKLIAAKCTVQLDLLVDTAVSGAG